MSIVSSNISFSNTVEQSYKLLAKYPKILFDFKKNQADPKLLSSEVEPELIELILDGAIAYRENKGMVLYTSPLRLDYEPEVVALYCDGMLTMLKHRSVGLMCCQLPHPTSIYESMAYLRMEFLS